MRRGFKTQAEKLALKHRTDFGVAAHQKLNPKKFLQSIGFVVWTPEEIPGIKPESLRQLTQTDPDSWSGVTVREDDLAAIIVNSAHAPTRRASTLMHEWAHIELRHKPSRADRSAGGFLLLSDYPSDLEDEADWLAGCILAPRDGLLQLCAKGWTADQIAKHFGISVQMANWRIGKTGVMRQLGRRR